MAVGAIGIMAFAALQLKSYEVGEQSRFRSAAAFIAVDAYERMASNSQDFAARNVYQGEVGDDWEESSDNSDRRYYILTDCDNADNPCDPDEMAIADIINLKRIAAATLPNGNIAHKKCGTSDDYDCIIVAWNDTADEIEQCSLLDGSGLGDCYILQVKIW